jgi:hypothetical protein
MIAARGRRSSTFRGGLCGRGGLRQLAADQRTQAFGLFTPKSVAVAVCWNCDNRPEIAAAPSRRSFVVGWKAFRYFDDELGIVPSYSTDAPALGVLELEDRRRDAHRRCADDDMEAPSVADDCSDLEHGHRHTPNACAGKESAASPARSIPGSGACPLGGSVSSFRQKATTTRGDDLVCGRERICVIHALADPRFIARAEGPWHQTQSGSPRHLSSSPRPALLPTAAPGRGAGLLACSCSLAESHHGGSGRATVSSRTRKEAQHVRIEVRA